jgi:hypothetical protein
MAKPTVSLVDRCASIALRHPGVTRSTACSKDSFKTGGKAFCFAGPDDRATTVMLKLRDSLPEAVRLAATEPARFKVGVHGWVTITMTPDQPAPATHLLERWIDESFNSVRVGKSAAAKTTSRKIRSRRRR